MPKKFWKLENTVHYFLEEKNELPEERALLRDNNWLFDLEFLVDVASHINDLNSKLQGTSKLFPSLDKALNMKLKMSVSQLENEDLNQFSHLKEQSERAATRGNLKKYTEKNKLLQISFHDYGKADCIHVFINPLSLSEKIIMKMPSNIQMELIDLKTNSSLKMKFDELSSALNASDMIQFRRSLPCENFKELRTFAQSYMSFLNDI